MKFGVHLWMDDTFYSVWVYLSNRRACVYPIVMQSKATLRCKSSEATLPGIHTVKLFSLKDGPFNYRWFGYVRFYWVLNVSMTEISAKFSWIRTHLVP